MFFGRLTKRKLFSAISQKQQLPVRTRQRQSIAIDDRQLNFILVRSRLARNISLKISNQNELEVVVPYRFSLSALPPLLIGKREWISGKLSEAREKSKKHG